MGKDIFTASLINVADKNIITNYNIYVCNFYLFLLFFCHSNVLFIQILIFTFFDVIQDTEGMKDSNYS